mmetsp:Transcript_8293/g.30605  ORF Transcript_8293/g.30605 Transcript_8293/m.30605 type:complete len:275 (+) Transcript_8293:1064-1888(+)
MRRPSLLSPSLASSMVRIDSIISSLDILKEVQKMDTFWRRFGSNSEITDGLASSFFSEETVRTMVLFSNMVSSSDSSSLMLAVFLARSFLIQMVFVICILPTAFQWKGLVLLVGARLGNGGRAFAAPNPPIPGGPGGPRIPGGGGGPPIPGGGGGPPIPGGGGGPGGPLIPGGGGGPPNGGGGAGGPPIPPGGGGGPPIGGGGAGGPPLIGGGGPPVFGGAEPVDPLRNFCNSAFCCSSCFLRSSIFFLRATSPPAPRDGSSEAPFDVSPPFSF